MLKHIPTVLAHNKNLKITIEDCFRLEIIEDANNSGLLKDFYLWLTEKGINEVVNGILRRYYVLLIIPIEYKQEVLNFLDNHNNKQ